MLDLFDLTILVSLGLLALGVVIGAIGLIVPKRIRHDKIIGDELKRARERRDRG